LLQDLPSETLRQAGHTGDDDEGPEAVGVSVGQFPVLLHGGDGLDVLKVEGVPLDILKLPVVLKVHPGGMTLRHVDRLLRHVLQVDDARLNHCLSLEQVLGGAIAWVVAVARVMVIMCDQLHVVFIDWLLASGGLGQLLIGLEHLLKDQQERQNLVLARARNQDLGLRFENGLFDLSLEPLHAHELMVLPCR